MSYQVLARKWRPANFDQVVGQSHVLHALTNALSQQRLHHAYLFTGTRGVGKTSLARLFAKGLNCETGVTANPCGKCASCVEIAEGRFVDLIEVDAASRTKVDDTRELLDNVQYRPSRGRFKVYLIDEVHMLSRSSFNALLKTLEEPPEHVKFLLATTDPQKLPVTVLSRCLQFNLKSLTQDDIAGQLNHVLTQEQLPFEPQALTLLAKSANGSMRDALSLTDQAIAFGAGQVMLQQVQTMLGTIDEQQVIALLDALLKGDVANLMHLTAQILSYGAEADEVLRSLLELLHQITLTQFAPAASQMSLYSEQIKTLAGSLKPEQIQLYYQILLTGRKDLPHAPDPKSGLEMALLRAVAFLPESVAGHWTPAREGEGTPGKAKSAGGATGTASVLSATDTTPQSDVTGEASSVNVTSQTGEAMATSFEEIAPAKPNETETAVSATSAPVTAGDEADDDDSAMLAEQALLISQAESMGYSQAQTDESSVQTDSMTQHEDVHQTKENESVQATDNHSEPMISDVANAAEIEPSGEAVKSAQTSVASGQSDVTTKTGVDDTMAEPCQSNASTDVALVSPEDTPAVDAVASEYSYSGEDDLSSYEQYFTGNGDAAMGQEMPVDIVMDSTGDLSGLSFEPAEVPAAPLAPVTPAVSSAPALDDDFLDSVLAARDSLMAGLKEEEEAQAPEVKVKAQVKPAPRTPKVDESVAQQVVPETQETEPGQQSSMTRQTMTAEVETQNNESAYLPSASLDIEDRPPWEEPAEQPVAVMPDKEDLFSPEFRAHDEMLDEQAPEPDTEPFVDSAETQAASEVAPSHSAQSVETSAPVQAPAEQAAAASLLPALASEVTGHELDLHWYKQMSALKIGGRVRQLAVNSVCYVWGEQIELLLKPDQKHLAAAVAIEQLTTALVDVAGFELSVTIQIGSDEQRETPREVRARFHSELLAQARSALHQDDNIRWLMSFMGAQLDDDSVVYPPELLSLKGRSIPELGSQ